MAKLIINFVLRYDETSKDSNSSTVNIAVSNKKVRIVKEYDGFGAPENEKLEKELSDELLKLIMDYLKEHQLNKNLKELKETKDIGIAGFLKIKVFKPDTTFIQIEGKTNIWGSDEYIEKNWGSEFVKSQTNIENMEYFDRAKSFVNFIEGL